MREIWDEARWRANTQLFGSRRGFKAPIRMEAPMLNAVARTARTGGVRDRWTLGLVFWSGAAASGGQARCLQVRTHGCPGLTAWPPPAQPDSIDIDGMVVGLPSAGHCDSRSGAVRSRRMDTRAGPSLVLLLLLLACGRGRAPFALPHSMPHPLDVPASPHLRALCPGGVTAMVAPFRLLPPSGPERQTATWPALRWAPARLAIGRPTAKLCFIIRL